MRLLGVNIPDNKKLPIALTYIYGIGPKVALDILERTKMDPNKRANELTPDDITKIQNALDTTPIEGELRQYNRSNIDRLKTIGSHRGNRHSKRLPTRGQRTKTNSRTVRGNVRNTAGSGKRKVALK